MTPSSAWTDERVHILCKLWRDGQSASAIARALGGGITRNAVIGKVHRLGLSGHGTPARPGTRRPKTPKPEPRLRLAGRVARPVAWPAVAEPVPEGGLADIVTVGAHACRWPMGDPKAADVALCGRPAVRGAYCAPHGALAYRPVARDHLLKLAGLA